MSLSVKICGLSTPETIEAAVAGGADYIGFVFYPKSPRHVTADRAADLVRLVPRTIRRCGLFVDPDDGLLDALLKSVPLDLLQLHGNEPPERCAALRERFRRPVMKAISIATAEDVARAESWIGAVDLLLFDAKPPPRPDALPGGNGLPFDWRLLAGRSWPVPWMLSGGLNAGNLRDAVRTTQAPMVDVSSGVEDSPGIKNAGTIREFLAVAKGL
ncbi:MAG: phosphoribosylanthranilate isomerase [Aliidongia sp.]|nr:phosphoribosylanthranilate isomerase [Aliidongia sp.]